MTMQARLLPFAVCVVMLCCASTLAQSPEGRPANALPQTREQSPTLPPNATSLDIVASELGLLRKSLQTLNTRLRDISDKVLTPDANASAAPGDKQSRIANGLDILTRAEQRAEIMRKQLLELIEKETLSRSRLVQIEEELRPESIERTMNMVGTTRTVEVREVRRRVLENERRGFENLLSQTAQSRLRLEEDVKQADGLVSRLRQRILPVIEKEIEKITPN
jgi:hypothetical protein